VPASNDEAFQASQSPCFWPFGVACMMSCSSGLLLIWDHVRYTRRWFELAMSWLLFVNLQILPGDNRCHDVLHFANTSSTQRSALERTARCWIRCLVCCAQGAAQPADFLHQECTDVEHQPCCSISRDQAHLPHKLPARKVCRKGLSLFCLFSSCCGFVR
jgi:hypothetical protein